VTKVLLASLQQHWAHSLWLVSVRSTSIIKAMARLPPQAGKLHFGALIVCSRMQELIVGVVRE